MEQSHVPMQSWPDCDSPLWLLCAFWQLGLGPSRAPLKAHNLGKSTVFSAGIKGKPRYSGGKKRIYLGRCNPCHVCCPQSQGSDFSLSMSLPRCRCTTSHLNCVEFSTTTEIAAVALCGGTVIDIPQDYIRYLHFY